MKLLELELELYRVKIKFALLLYVHECFRVRVRLRTYSTRSLLPPANEITRNTVITPRGPCRAFKKCYVRKSDSYERTQHVKFIHIDSR